MTTTTDRPLVQLRRRNGLRWDVAAVTVALALVAAAAIVGWHLVHRRVPLFVEFPPLFARWLPHTGIGTAPALLLGAGGVLLSRRVVAIASWPRLVAGAGAASVGWTASLALVDGWQRGWAGRLTTSDEYLHDLPRIAGVGAFLAGFTDHILDFRPGAWTTHVSSHPPGATLVFLVLDRIGLGGGGWAGALVIGVGSTAGIAVCITVAALGAPLAARTIVPFAVFFPGAVWIGVSADGLFTAVAAWGIALTVIGGRRHRTGRRSGWAIAGAGGVLLGFAGYLSYGLALVVIVVVAVALLLPARSHVAAAAGVLGVVVAFSAAGFNWLRGEQLLTIRYEQGIASVRPYSYFVWANLAALVLCAGPVVAAGLRRAVPVVIGAFKPTLGQRVPRMAGIRDREILVPASLSLAAALAIVLADVTGLSKAETERIWLPFAIWLITALALLPRRLLPVALGVQIAVPLVVNHLLLTYW